MEEVSERQQPKSIILLGEADSFAEAPTRFDSTAKDQSSGNLLRMLQTWNCDFVITITIAKRLAKA
jgi:hypothetical protein